MSSAIKSKIYEFLLQQAVKRIDLADSMMKSIVESRDGDTKSSAGDKYETGRAMMHIEQEKIESRRAQAQKEEAVIKQLLSKEKSEEISQGSLVITDRENYLVALGIGKVTIDSADVFVVSNDSPVGNLLIGKRVGQSILLPSGEVSIQEIY